jgi:integrase
MTKRREPRQHRRRQPWTVDDARWFLESTWHAREALYAALVLVLVLGPRTGEVLGLAWDQVDLDEAELYVGSNSSESGASSSAAKLGGWLA